MSGGRRIAASISRERWAWVSRRKTNRNQTKEFQKQKTKRGESAAGRQVGFPVDGGLERAMDGGVLEGDVDGRLASPCGRQN